MQHKMKLSKNDVQWSKAEKLEQFHATVNE